MGYAKTQIENKFKYLKARYVKKRDNEGNKGSGESPYLFTIMTNLTISLEIIQMLNL
jgi:hypothetical protein